MKRFSNCLFISISLIAYSLCMAACQGNAMQAETLLAGTPTIKPLSTGTPRPSPTLRPINFPTPTNTPSATLTNTPIPTIQLPKLALTPLPFTPEPISILNAGRVTELTRWEITNPAFWQKADGSGMTIFPANWSFQLAFSANGATLILLPFVEFSLSGISAIYHQNAYSSCIFGDDPNEGRASVKSGFSGIPYLSIPDGKQIKLINPDLFESLGIDWGEYLHSPNGETIVIQSDNCQIQFIDIETGKSSEKIEPLRGDHFGFSADGKVFWSGPDQDGYIAFLNPLNGDQLQKTRVEWKHLAVMSKVEAEKIISIPIESQNRGEIPDVDKFFNIIAQAPDKKTFISSIHLNGWAHVKDSTGQTSLTRLSGKQKIVLWSMHDGGMLHLLAEKDEWKDEPIVAYSPDSQQAAIYANGDEKISLFDIDTGKQVSTLGRSGYLSLAYSPDGQILIAGTQASMELWNVATGSLLAEIPLQANLDDWAISPDGKYIATVSVDGRISLWGVQP